MAFTTRRMVAHKVLNSARFAAELAGVAGKTGKPLAEARREAGTALRELASVQIPLFGWLFDRGLGPLHTRAWSFDVDWPALKRLEQERAGKSLVFLPSHRSYADPFILTNVLRAAGIPRSYILAGDNLRFFPLSTIGRRAGAVFIRRSFGDDEVYKLSVREYMRHLVASGANLIWYMEGGRSRTGKLRRPRYGALRYLVDAIESGAAKDILLVPVSTTYDQLPEVAKLAAEEAGIAKAREGMSWLAGYARTQGHKRGQAHVRFGEPISLGQAHPSLDKIVFEVFQRINRITPVTAPALVTLALLSVHGHALSLQEVHDAVEPLLDYATQRGLPTVALDDLHGDRGVEEVLDTLVAAGVVGRHDGGLAPVFFVEPGQHPVAAFYRNSAIHWFVNRAIAELSIMLGGREGMADRSLELRDLLKFEFFFSEKQAFEAEIEGEMASLPNLEQAPFLIAHRVLPAFLEAYFIVADRLAALPADAVFDEKAFLAQCSAVGRQYVLQKRLRNPECVSLELFGNALALAANRGLVQPGSVDLADKRRRFVEETAAAVSAVSAIGELDYRLRHGALRSP
jgi:glycerol-3-phosphate O-acyltransferase